MLKKKIILIAALILTLSIFLQGCGDKSDVTITEKSNKAGHPDFSKMQTQSAGEDEDIVDLRELNGNMLYAQVYSMMLEPEKFEGKTIKVRGQYYGEPDPNGTAYYHFVFISDAAACCQQGLEFVRDGDFKVPQDYPSLDQEIEVSGIWGKYKDGDNTFWRLNSATMEILGK